MRHTPSIRRLALGLAWLCSALVIAACNGDAPSHETRLDESVHTARAHFGYAVAMSDDYAIVGQPDDDPQGPNSGAAYVYKRQGDGWVERSKLVLEGGTAADFFGIAVAIDNHTAIIGASGADQDRGAAYLFERVDQAWIHVQTLTATTAGPGHAFGLSVAISNDFAFVGAPGHDAAGGQAGAVYVFQRQQGRWQAVQELLAHDAQPGSRFGASIALSNLYAVIGAPKHDREGHPNDDYGAAYLFELFRGVWVESAQIQASDGAKRDYFGSAVAISDRDILVGAPNHAGAGTAYLFERQAGAWRMREQHRLPAPVPVLGAQFGAAVALFGDMLLIGAYAYDPAHSDNTTQVSPGAAYLFWRRHGTWIAGDALPRQTDQRQSHFGYALALSAGSAIVGAPALSGHGEGRIYTYSNLYPNVPPDILSTPLTQATVGDLYLYDINAIDADNDPLHYTLRHAPAGMTIDTMRGLVTWTPDAPGQVSVEIEIRDARDGVATQAYTLTVEARPTPVPHGTQTPDLSTPGMAANRAPQIISQPITQADFLPLMPLVTVTDAHEVQHTSRLNGQPYTPGTPITQAGTYQLTVEATDEAGNSAAMTLHFTIESAARP